MSTTYLEAIREGLWEEMERDANVFLIGEDIGEYGGAFKVTAGFFERFGARRVVDTPISEAAIVGAAVGAALMGLRPVAEMQFADFSTKALDALHEFQGAVFTLRDLLFSFVNLFDDRLEFLICLHLALAGFLTPQARAQVFYLLFDRAVHFPGITVFFLFRKILHFEMLKFFLQLGYAPGGFITASDQLVLFVFDLLVLNQTFKLIKQFTTSW